MSGKGEWLGLVSGKGEWLGLGPKVLGAGFGARVGVKVRDTFGVGFRFSELALGLASGFGLDFGSDFGSGLDSALAGCLVRYRFGIWFGSERVRVKG